jgi:transposase
VEIWFQDEARVGQRGTVTRIWAKKGTRPRVIRQQQFEYAYLFGAVCPARAQAVGLVLPTIGTYCMQQHVNEIAKCIEAGNHGVIVFDQAAWHTTKKLQVPKNISLLPLPPVSPELNPTEQVWQALRDRYLGNRCFDSYEHILECFCEAWNAFTSVANAVRKLCSREWANIMC